MKAEAIKSFYNDTFFEGETSKAAKLTVSIELPSANVIIPNKLIKAEHTVAYLFELMKRQILQMAKGDGIRIRFQKEEETMVLNCRELYEENSLHDLFHELFKASLAPLEVVTPEAVPGSKQEESETAKSPATTKPDAEPVNIEKVIYRDNEYIVEEYPEEAFVVVNDTQKVISPKSVVFRGVLKQYRNMKE